MALDGVAYGIQKMTKAFQGNTIQESVNALQELQKLQREAVLKGDIDLMGKVQSNHKRRH
jgi:hypothetical protein